VEVVGAHLRAAEEECCLTGEAEEVWRPSSWARYGEVDWESKSIVT
jgi:hypothetical protein